MLRGGLAGSVRLLTNTNGYLSFLPDRLLGFLLDHPQIDVQLAERTSEAIVEAIQGSQAELGVTAAEGDAALRRRSLRCLPGKTQIKFEYTLAFPFVAGPSHGLFVGHTRRSAEPLRARTQVSDHAQVCRLVSAGGRHRHRAALDRQTSTCRS